jgi:serine protease Do/serine protease DegQ
LELVLPALAVFLVVASTPAILPAVPDVVLVEGGGFHGSGIVWSRGRVLTALHVVEEMPSVTVSVAGGGQWAATVVDRDPALDLALLAVDGDLGAALPLGASSELTRGERVALAGCPGRACGRGEGTVLEASRAFAGGRYLALAAPVRPGASGGPVVDARGALVGVVDLLVRGAGVALAIPVERAAARFPRGTAARSP